MDRTTVDADYLAATNRIMEELSALHLRRKKMQQGWCSHTATETLEIETRLYSLAAQAWLITKDGNNG